MGFVVFVTHCGGIVVAATVSAATSDPVRVPATTPAPSLIDLSPCLTWLPLRSTRPQPHSAPPTPGMPQTHTAFFYGTLMAPAVLKRVTSHDPASSSAPLTSRPALLHGHRRHRVRGADYPAIIPLTAGAKLEAGEVRVAKEEVEGSSVRGTIVSGLTDEDVWRLDLFEGDEYERRTVNVKMLEADEEASKLGQAYAHGTKSNGHAMDWKPGQEVEAETYIWVAGRHRLEDEEWDFDEFVKEKMWRWAPAEDDGSTRQHVNRQDDEDEGFEDVKRAVEERQKESRDDATGGRLLGGGFEDAVKEGRIGVSKEEVVESAV